MVYSWGRYVENNIICRSFNLPEATGDLLTDFFQICSNSIEKYGESRTEIVAQKWQDILLSNVTAY